MNAGRLVFVSGCLAVLSLLAGCSKTGDMKALLERGEYEQAGEWYIGREAELRGEDDAPTLIDRAVQGMAVRLADRSAPLTARLGAVSFRSGSEQWGMIRADLGEGRQILDRYRRYAALRDGSPLARELRAVDAAVRHAEETLRRGAPEQFVRYDHQDDFFREFPLLLSEPERRDVLAKGFPALLKTLETSEPGATQRIVGHYAPYEVTPDRQMKLLSAYEAAVVRESGWREPLGFAQTLALIERVADSPVAGFRSSRPVAVVEVTRACADADFDWSIKEVAIAHRRIGLADLAETLAALKSEGVRLAAVAVPDCLVVNEAVLRVEKRKAKKIGATRTVPNPAHPVAVAAVAEAQDALNKARIAARAAQAAKDAYRSQRSSNNPWMNLLTDIVVDGGSAVAVGSYEADLAQKQAQLANMPTTVQVNVYHFYQVPVVTYERSRRHQVDVYVADLTSDRVEHFRLGDRNAVTATDTLDVDATDPDRTVVAVENERRQVILGTVDQQPIVLTAARCLSELRSKSGRAAGSVARLPELIRTNADQWRAGNSEEQKKAAATLALLGPQLGDLRSRIAVEGALGEAPDGRPTRTSAAVVPAIGVASAAERPRRGAGSVPTADASPVPPPTSIAPQPAAVTSAPPPSPDPTPAPAKPPAQQRVYPTW